MEAGGGGDGGDEGDGGLRPDSRVPVDARVDTMPDACVPQQEVCNGIDDDCNGSIDDAEGLCSDPERPMCARHEQTASCGCLLDTDCGPRESGRVCDAAKRRCVSGCSNDPGRNGCPRGFECIAADGDAFCEPEQPAPPLSGVGGEAPAPDDVFNYFQGAGFTLEHLKTCGGGLGCNEYVFVRQS